MGAQFLGPAVATPLLILRGPALAWCLCSLLYLTSAALSIAVGESRVQAGTGVGRYRLAGSLRYLQARPLAWTAIWSVALHCALTMAYQGMLPMFVTTGLRGDASSYGALLTAMGVGAMTGSLCLAWLSEPRHRPALFVVSLVGSGLALAALGAAPSITFAIMCGFFAGGTQAMFMSMALALIQSSVGNEFRGRATSFYQMITLTPMALFGWGMGGLADITEPRPLMIAGGVAFVIAMAVYTGISPWLRGLFRPQSWQQASEGHMVRSGEPASTARP
jgi:MFS family permease